MADGLVVWTRKVSRYLMTQGRKLSSAEAVRLDQDSIVGLHNLERVSLLQVQPLDNLAGKRHLSLTRHFYDHALRKGGFRKMSMTALGASFRKVNPRGVSALLSARLLKPLLHPSHGYPGCSKGVVDVGGRGGFGLARRCRFQGSGEALEFMPGLFAPGC